MQTAVKRARMTDDERRAAKRLLENGALMSRFAGPADRAERYCDLADLLVGRIDSAAAADDAGAVGRLGPKYGRVQNGLGADLKRLHAVASVAPEDQKRLERIAKRQAEAEKRLAAAAAKTPEKAARQAIRRAMERQQQQQEKRGEAGPVY
jgi:hypothetical protein